MFHDDETSVSDERVMELFNLQLDLPSAFDADKSLLVDPDEFHELVKSREEMQRLATLVDRRDGLRTVLESGLLEGERRDELRTVLAQLDIHVASPDLKDSPEETALLTMRLPDVREAANELKERNLELGREVSAIRDKAATSGEEAQRLRSRNEAFRAIFKQINEMLTAYRQAADRDLTTKSLEVNVESLDQALVVSIRPLAVTDVTPYSYR